MAEFPFITVVMPVRNEERFVGETLLQLLEQDYPEDRFEVVVADGISDDRTAEIVRSVGRNHRNVLLMPNEKRLSGAGRNVGFQNGRGDLFLVMDGHCHIPDRRLLRNVARCFETSGADCLGRPQPLDPPGLTPFQKAVALARASRIGHGSDSLIYCDYEGYASPVSNGAAYRRSVFEKVGYVDESFDACEDVEFNYRVEQAGLRCYTSPSLSVKYYPRESLRKLFRQLIRYGKGRTRFLRKHPRALEVDMLVPPLFLAGLPMTIVALSLLPYVPGSFLRLLSLSLCAIYGGYLLLVLAESLRTRKRAADVGVLTMATIFFCIHTALGCGFWLGLLFDKRN